jgi:UPF0755 protein
MRKTKKKTKKFILPGLLLLVVVLGAAGLWLYLQQGGAPVNPQSGDSVVLEIPGGSGTESIANLLEDNGLIKNSFVFRLKSKISGYDGNFKAGTYRFSPSMDMAEIMDIILSGRSIGQTFQIIEGLTIDQIADSLEEQGIVSAEDFLAEAKNGAFDYPFMEYLPDGQNRLEGFLFPNQYEAPLNATAHQVIDIMLNEFDRIFPESDYDKAEALGMDVYDVVIIASLIEREVREDEERPLVASVVYNRLEQGMKLEFCSTVQYILGEPQAVLSIADTRIESPYNTYLNPGLPPGPICSPGEAAIKGALNPEDTDYLYFVLKSKDAKTHNFAATYEEFLRYKDVYKASFN